MVTMESNVIKEEKNHDVTLTLNQPNSKQTTYDSTTSSPQSFRLLQLLKPNEENYLIKNLIMLGDIDILQDYINENVEIIDTIKAIRFEFKNYSCCHIAVVKNNLPLLKYLIETIGCDPNALDINNNNCINIAYQHRKIMMIEYLLTCQLQPYYELNQFLSSSTPTSLSSKYISDCSTEDGDDNRNDERSRTNSCDSTEFRTPYNTNNYMTGVNKFVSYL
jgi:hypothetical protein